MKEIALQRSTINGLSVEFIKQGVVGKVVCWNGCAAHESRSLYFRDFCEPFKHAHH